MITDIEGVAVGHYTDREARTGCTVVLLPDSSIASAEVRGGAPGTREFELLEPTRTVQGPNAIVLSGGSAFGLAASDGVVRWCVENRIGYATKAALVPIVVSAVIYDLGEGSADIRPTAADGHRAALAATNKRYETGSVGAGAGATYSKWRPGLTAVKGGIGTATIRSGAVVVSALMVVNALGEIRRDEPDLSTLLQDIRSASTAGSNQPAGSNQLGEATTIGVVVTNAKLTKPQCFLVAQSAHDGIARAIWPAHLSGDGDAIIAVSVPTRQQDNDLVDVPVDAVRAMAIAAVVQAIRSLAPASASPPANQRSI